MSGTFTPGGSRPPLPGAYFAFQAATPPPNLVNILGVVAVPFVHPWGPANQVVKLNSFSDFLTYFGDGGVTPPAYSAGYTAVMQAFVGEGLPGRGGAAQVLAYRMVSSTGASASASIQNTSAQNALEIAALYAGSYGDLIAWTNTADSRNPTTQSDFTIYVNGLQAETYTYTNGDVTQLAALINDPLIGSKWVSANSLVSATNLITQATPLNLAGGDDGSTLAAVDWTNMLAVFQNQPFSLFAPYDLEDASILASVVAWGQAANAAGQRFMTVIGGPSDDVATTAAQRSETINDPNFLNIGVGTYQDSVLGVLNTAQLAPRLAGIAAARGDSGGLSYSRLAGLSIISGPSDSDILYSITTGWMAISQDSNQLAPVRFEKGVTTFITPNSPNLPFTIYSNPKFVRTMQFIELTITQWVEGNVIGVLPVSPQTIEYVLGWVKGFFTGLEANQVIQPGWTIGQDTQPVPTPQDDFIALLYSVAFDRDTEQVLSRVIVS